VFGYPFFYEKGGRHLNHYQVGLELAFLWWPFSYFCDGGHGYTWLLPLLPSPSPFLFIFEEGEYSLLVILLLVILL
jgi:hypothetical protein